MTSTREWCENGWLIQVCDEHLHYGVEAADILCQGGICKCEKCPGCHFCQPQKWCEHDLELCPNCDNVLQFPHRVPYPHHADGTPCVPILGKDKQNSYTITDEHADSKCPTCGSVDGVPLWRSVAPTVPHLHVWHNRDERPPHRDASCDLGNCHPCPTCSVKKEPCKLCNGTGEWGKRVIVSTISDGEQLCYMKCPNGCKVPGTNLWTPGMVGADPLAKLEPTTPHKIWIDLYDGNGHFGPHEVECPCPLHRKQESDETSQGEQSSGDKGTRNQAASSDSSLFAEVAMEILESLTMPGRKIHPDSSLLKYVNVILSRRFGPMVEALKQIRYLPFPGVHVSADTLMQDIAAKALTDLEKK